MSEAALADWRREGVLQRVVLVTGPSGAGRGTAIRALEDLRFEAIDNLPIALLPRLLLPEAAGRPLAIGIDVRTRGFSAAAMLEALGTLRRTEGVAGLLLYLDCSDEAALRRFSETRRRHPLAPEEGPEAGLRAERDLLAPVRERADILIDTSALTPHELKAELGRWFGPEGGGGPAVLVESFSFRRGPPPGLDMMLDVRCLRNPYWEPALRARDGRDPEVAAFVAADPRFAGLVARFLDLVLFLLPAHKSEGKAYLSIGIGCTGGQHRSVAVAEAVMRGLAASGWPVSVRHREVERPGGVHAAR